MELNAHDLIVVKDRLGQIINEGIPDWATQSLLRVPYVVVCSSPRRDGFVTVGIRGPQSANRIKIFLKLSVFQQIITPLMLTDARYWKVKAPDRLSRQILSLEAISLILNGTKLNWGPTGGTGFELATGLKATTEDSDLDLLLTVPLPISVDYANALWNELKLVSLCRIDIRLNTPKGEVELAKFIKSSTVLTQTANGPILMERAVLWEKPDYLPYNILK